jgi:hypothetical protein
MGSTSEELIEAHKAQRALRLRDVGRKVHHDLESVLARLLAKDPLARFSDAASAARALRSARTEPAPGAAGAEEEEFEDPVPILSARGTGDLGSVEEPGGEPGAEPEVVPPKPLDPGLEQALLGNVAREPRVAPARSPSAFPKWMTPLRAAAAAAVLCAVVVSAIFALGGDSRRARKKAAPTAAVAAERPKPAPVVAAPTPEAAPVAAAAEPEPPPVKKAAKAAPTPAKKVALTPPAPPPSRLAGPERLLAKGDAAAAVQSLDAVLAGSLSAPERAQGTRLMAEAQAKAGNKQDAVAWYRKYLQLAGNPEERARVVKKIAELNR